jgi:hypothetical protein
MKNILLIILLFISNYALAQQKNRTEQWQADLQFYHQELEKNHIDIYNRIDKQSFEKELSVIFSTVEKHTDWEIAMHLMQLTRKIGDGHTSVSVMNWETNYFPIAIKKISEKWRVIKTTEDYPEILGTSIEKIDGIDILEIEKKLSTTVQFVENNYSEIIRIGEYMPLSELLFALKITKSTEKAKFQFLTDEGKKIQITINSIPKNELKNQKYTELEITIPEIVKPATVDFDYLWFTQVEGTEATYIRFDSYPEFEETILFAEKLVEFMMQNQSRQVIIDLRNNGGGDLYIGLILANALNIVDGIDWKNGVYVLSSGITFSAGASNVALFRELLNAKIVGTPTGSNPTGYQDMDEFVLPNSNLRITYSKRLFRIQEVASDGVQPDIFIDYDWQVYSKGIDNVLTEVLRIISSE